MTDGATGGTVGGVTGFEGALAGGARASVAGGFVGGDSGWPINFANAPARRVLTSSVPVIVSFDFLRITLIVDSLLVDMVDVLEGLLSLVEVTPNEPSVSRLLSLGGTGGAWGGSGPSSTWMTTEGVAGSLDSGLFVAGGVAGEAGTVMPAGFLTILMLGAFVLLVETFVVLLEALGTFSVVALVGVFFVDTVLPTLA